MNTIDVNGESLPIRPDLLTEIDRAWDRLCRAGTWWSGAERRAIAAEARQAENCKLCQERKTALSPYTVAATHDALPVLPNTVVEAIHRIKTDAGRITQKWLHGIITGAEETEADLAETHYVEIIGIIALITALDTFDDALGRPRRPLPPAQAGQPSRQRPVGAKRDLAWVATVAPDQIGTDEANPYPIHGEKNIHRALSLVPQEVFNFFDLDVELYLQDHQIRDFGTEYRAINHAQIELLAGRVSALNGCYY